MSTAALETFIKKYQTAKNYNSKELRLTLLEAEELSLAIALLLSSSSELGATVIRLQSQLLEQRNEIEVSGGSFT